MISYILLISSIILVILGYFLLVFIYLFNNNKTKDITAADQVQKILDDDNAINLIEDKDALFSHYNIKRDIVKLKTKTYNSKNIFSLAIATLLSGYSLVKNNILNYISYIFKELKIISFIPFINIEAVDKLKIKDEDINKVLNIISKVTTIFFISTLVQIIRLVVIILNI